MTYQEVCRYFKKGSNGNYICPAHDDHNASLSISDGKHGTVLHCHAGCTTSCILEAAGLRMSDLFNDSVNKEKWIGYVEKRKGKQVEGIYHYFFFNGSYAYTKLRLSGKEFAYGKLDNEKFTFGLNGQRLVDIDAVYGSPDAIRKAIKDCKPVFIPEGEKDTDTLIKNGYAAFTSGSAKSWHDGLKGITENADVYILMDNDEPGRTFAESVYSSLTGTAKTVKIINPMPDKPHGDISDYFQEGHTKDDFEKLLQEASEGVHVTAADPEHSVVCDNGKARTVKKQIRIEKASEVISKDPEWLIPGYIPRNGITTLAGDGGVGKTSIWCSLVASITTGKQPFILNNSIPFDNEPENVLVLSAEDSWQYVLAKRLRDNGADMERVWYIPTSDERFGKLDFDSELLHEIIETNRPNVIVFDPLQAFVPCDKHMGDRNAMRKCFSSLIGYGEKYGLTSIIIAHANKQSNVWGRKRIADSSDIWDASRSVLMAGLTKDSEIRYISHEKSNWGKLNNSVLYELNECVPVFKAYTHKKDREFISEDMKERNMRPAVEDAKMFIVKTLTEYKQMEVSELDELAKVNSVSENSLKNAKTELRKEGATHTWSVGNGRNGMKKFFISLTDTEKINE